jgi:hypothetical protein
MHSSKRCTVLLLLAFAAVPLSAANADLVTVTTHVSSPLASQGRSNHGDILITNNSTADIRVKLTAQVVYADGTVQALTGLGDPGVLPPGGGYALSINFIIPPDAAIGAATFTAQVTATSGGLEETESSSANFVVIP